MELKKLQIWLRIVKGTMTNFQGFHFACVYGDNNLSYILRRMKILFNVAFAGSQQVESKCMSPKRFYKEELGEEK